MNVNQLLIAAILILTGYTFWRNRLPYCKIPLKHTFGKESNQFERLTFSTKSLKISFMSLLWINPAATFSKALQRFWKAKQWFTDREEHGAWKGLQVYSKNIL